MEEVARGRLARNDLNGLVDVPRYPGTPVRRVAGLYLAQCFGFLFMQRLDKVLAELEGDESIERMAMSLMGWAG